MNSLVNLGKFCFMDSLKDIFLLGFQESAAQLLYACELYSVQNLDFLDLKI